MLTDQIKNRLLIYHIYQLTKEGMCYLSVIRDLYDNSIVAYKMDKEQSINFVLDTIDATQRKKSLQSCSSTVTKDFSTHPTHTSV